MLCPKCKIKCEQNEYYKSIGRCPKCGDLLTTSSGNEVDIIQVGEKDDN
jgi:transcription initiation factor IIE alpha subunit